MATLSLFRLECFYKGRFAGVELTDICLGVVGFDHHVGNVEALTEVLDGSAFDAVGLAGLQYYVDDAVCFELGDQLGQQLFGDFGDNTADEAAGNEYAQNDRVE